MVNPADQELPAPVKELHDVLEEGSAQVIADAVAAAERQTSSEIVVRLAGLSPQGPIRTIAEEEFIRLGLAGLPLKNGVLIYVSLNRRAVELVVGEEAARLISKQLWQKAVDSIAAGFAGNRARDGVLEGIRVITPELARAFPPEEIDSIKLPNVTEDQ